MFEIFLLLVKDHLGIGISLGGSLIVFLICLKVAKDKFKYPEWEQTYRRQLQSDSRARIYRRIMAPLHRGLYRALTPENIVDHPRPNRWFRNFEWFITPRSSSPSAARLPYCI